MILLRNSHRRCSIKNDILKNFTKFSSKRLCRRLFLNKVPGLLPATFLKKKFRHQTQVFPKNFAKFLRIPFFIQFVFIVCQVEGYRNTVKSC